MGVTPLNPSAHPEIILSLSKDKEPLTLSLSKGRAVPPLTL